MLMIFADFILCVGRMQVLLSLNILFLLSGCSILGLHLFHFVLRLHKDDNVPVSVICSCESSWVRLLLVSHRAARRLSYLLLLLDSWWTPLNWVQSQYNNLLCQWAVGTICRRTQGRTSLPAEKAPFRLILSQNVSSNGHTNNPHVPASLKWGSNSLIFVQIKACTLQSGCISRDPHRANNRGGGCGGRGVSLPLT